MTWLCAEIRDPSALALLRAQLRDQLVAVRGLGLFDPDARVYVTPHKASHRLYFNDAAHAMLPALQGLAHAPCDAPTEGEMREPAFS